MRIGIDISQVAYAGTGVGRYVNNLITAILQEDSSNEYVLFGASLRRRRQLNHFIKQVKSLHPRVSSVILPIPPTALHVLWNVLHVVPVEWFTGKLDVFWSSDWTQPPLIHAKGVTTIHDVSFLRYPESFVASIIDVQMKRLARAAQECQVFLCDSTVTQADAVQFLGIPKSKTQVVYPGFSL